MRKSVLKNVRDSKKMLYDSNLFHGGGWTFATLALQSWK